MNAAARRRRAGATALATSVLILAASQAVDAAASRVTLLQSPGISAGAKRCLTLIRDELIAGGFEVISVDAGSATDPVSVARLMRLQEGVATVGLLGDPESGPAELWILDNIGGKAEVRRIPAPTDDPDRVAEVLAIRTIEVLRASALKLLIESSGTAPRPADPPATRTAAASETAGLQTNARFAAVETGVSLLVNPGGLGPAAIPLARLRIAVVGPVMTRLTLAGFGTRPHVETSRGTAVIAQELGLLEVGFTFRRHRLLQFVISAGGGVLHVRSEAQGLFPYLGQRDSRWAGIVDGGVGIVAASTGRLALALETHVMLASPHPVIRFVELDAATVAHPAIWTTLTLMAWL